jgi:hypothetical protein
MYNKRVHVTRITVNKVHLFEKNLYVISIFSSDAATTNF